MVEKTGFALCINKKHLPNAFWICQAQWFVSYEPMGYGKRRRMKGDDAVLFQDHYHDGQSIAVVNATGALHIHNDFTNYTLFPWHCHSFYELQYYVDPIDGNATGTDRMFKLFAPFQPHSCEDEGYRYSLMVQFSQQFVRLSVPSLPEGAMLRMAASSISTDGIHLAKEGPADQLLRKIADVIPSYYDDCETEAHNRLSVAWHTPLHELHLNSDLLQLLLCLLEAGMIMITYDGIMNLGTHFQHLVSRIISSPEEHLSMSDAAALSHMSYGDFSRNFKNTTGYGYTEFCNMSRIGRAEELLRFEDISTTELAERLNFGSVSYLNRVFLRFTGLTPTAYKAICHHEPSKKGL